MNALWHIKERLKTKFDLKNSHVNGEVYHIQCDKKNTTQQCLWNRSYIFVIFLWVSWINHAMN